MSKPLRDMTDAELLAEWQKWEDEITNAAGWGAALAAADEFRKDCAREMARRPFFKHGITTHV